MRSYESTFGSLLDELWRWDSDMDDFFASSPWISDIRTAQRGAYPPVNVGDIPKRAELRPRSIEVKTL